MYCTSAGSQISDRGTAHLPIRGKACRHRLHCPITSHHQFYNPTAEEDPGAPRRPNYFTSSDIVCPDTATDRRTVVISKKKEGE